MELRETEPLDISSIQVRANESDFIGRVQENGFSLHSDVAAEIHLFPVNVL
jgi:hypothetical protein